MNKIYSYTSYKEYLRDVTKALGRGATSLLAEAAGCNRTYISQALTSKVQLTVDHIVGIAGFLKLSDEEADFLILLNLHERATSKKTEAAIEKRMNKIIHEELNLSKQITKKNETSEISETQKNKYYASWKYAAVHIATSVKELQNTKGVAKKLNISEKEAMMILNDLVEMGPFWAEYLYASWIASYITKPFKLAIEILR